MAYFGPCNVQEIVMYNKRDEGIAKTAISPRKPKATTQALFRPHPHRISLSNQSTIVTLNNLL